MSSFARGTHAYGECQRCGSRVAYRSLMNDGDIPGLRVCSTCWEPRHPQEDPPKVGADRQALAKPSPEVSVPDGEGTPATDFTTYLRN